MNASPAAPDRENRLQVQVGPLSLKNPILVASGTFGSGVEARAVMDPSFLGGIVVKTITRRPRAGNPPPRIVETASGMLNSIGLMNPGVDRFLEAILPEFATIDTVRIVNVAGESIEDFADLCARCDAHAAIDALELNVSCPNVSHGLDYGQDPRLLEKLVHRARASTKKPLVVKLTPNVADVAPLAKAAEAGGADALSLVNTYLGLAVDWRRRKPRLGSSSGGGGLSGPAIKPLALHAVRAAHRAVRLPLIGIGGIATVDDVMDFIVTGATAVQVGTMNFVQPDVTKTLVRDLEGLAASGEVTDIPSMVGTLETARGR